MYVSIHVNMDEYEQIGRYINACLIFIWTERPQVSRAQKVQLLGLHNVQRVRVSGKLAVQGFQGCIPWLMGSCQGLCEVFVCHENSYDFCQVHVRFLQCQHAFVVDSQPLAVNAYVESRGVAPTIHGSAARSKRVRDAVVGILAVNSSVHVCVCVYMHKLRLMCTASRCIHVRIVPSFTYPLYTMQACLLFSMLYIHIYIHIL